MPILPSTTGQHGRAVASSICGSRGSRGLQKLKGQRPVPHGAASADDAQEGSGRGPHLSTSLLRQPFRSVPYFGMRSCEALLFRARGGTCLRSSAGTVPTGPPGHRTTMPSAKQHCPCLALASSFSISMQVEFTRHLLTLSFYIHLISILCQLISSDLICFLVTKHKEEPNSTCLLHCPASARPKPSSAAGRTAPARRATPCRAKTAACEFCIGHKLAHGL